MTIVDDGSNDETATLAAGFDDPRLRLIRQRNAGVSAARNIGLGATGADAVLFLDADDWLSPNALASLATALRADPHAIAAVGPYARVPDGGAAGGRVVRPRSGDLLESLLVRNLFANGGHLLIHRVMLDATGPFHTGLRYGEDWEYWTRLARLGRFAAVRDSAPLLFARDRADGACRGMAVRPESFTPCLEAIFNAPALRSRLSATTLARFRRRADAEKDWIVGRELIRHGRVAEGRPFLLRSVHAAPSTRRLVLLAAGTLPLPRIGPFRPYLAPNQA